MSKIKKLLKSEKTVFTLDDLSAIWGQEKRTDTSQSAKQYAKNGELVRLRRGVYVLPKATPGIFEITYKLVSPSYLTGESALVKHGASFQFSNRITSAALISKRIKLNGTDFVYYKLNEQIFYNDLGISADENNVMIAGPERAIADLVYLTGWKFPFEDISFVDWDKLEEIGEIYGKKSVRANIAMLKEKYA